MKRQLLFFFLIFSVGLNAQKIPSNTEQAIFESVAPNAFATTATTGTFLGPYSNAARTYQLLIASSQLTNLTGKYLNSLAFRILPTASASWPTADVTVSDYDIYLSGSVDPANRSLTFASNVVGTQTQVRSGSLTIPANSVTTGGNPNAFSFYINFTTQYLYTGGNLLIEIRHPAFTGTSISTESVLASGAPGNGYGVTVSACWTGSYNTGATSGSQGNFSVVSLRASDVLGTTTFESLQVSVYPNPSSGEIHMDGNVEIYKIKAYNMLGQLVLEKAINSQTSTVDISNWNAGTYIVEMETETGIKKQKVIKN